MIGAQIPPEIDGPDPNLQACVVIPARNEADQLPATLAALLDQRDRQGRAIDRRTFEVIVLANNCTDATAEVGRRFAVQAAALATIFVIEQNWPAEWAHVGTARKWLMDLACRRLEAVVRPRGLIASTDADTRVGPLWLAESLAEVAAGADAVAGVIGVDARALRSLGARVRRAYWQDRVHRRLLVELEALVDPNPLDPCPRHDFHGGASLAITPATYRQVGGLPPLPSLEDVALAEALWRVDARFVHSPRVRVRTSVRQVGRTVGGQSGAISGWADAPVSRVPAAEASEAELVARARLRQSFRRRVEAGSSPWRPDLVEVDALARTLRIEPAILAKIMVGEGTFGSWLAEIGRLTPALTPATAPGLIPIDVAIEALRRRLRDLKNERAR